MTKEYILCAAIHYSGIDESPVHSVANTEEWPGIVITGFRHPHCISTWKATTGLNTRDQVQGFLTSKNRFVDREEAAKIAFESGQIKDQIKTLYSENLY